MPRSPLTLAATVTAALPGAEVVSVRALGSPDGRIDAAVAQLSDGRRVVVRVARTDEARSELAAEARVLRALSAGIRSLLPFRAPELLGQTTLGAEQAIVVDFLDGYRVEAADVPGGRGVASLLGGAIAAVHDLPVTVIRAEGLAARSADGARTEASRLVERADAAGDLPRELRSRWRALIDDDAAWRFEPTVVLDGVDADAFVFADGEEGPRIVGLLGWHGLSVADPATDLRWIANAPAAADAVHEAYVLASHGAPDAHLVPRARLYAELEFAKWLVHGADAGDGRIVRDAEGLLASLVDATADSDLAAPVSGDVDDALALLDRVPSPVASGIDTSMQTDAYDPAMLDAALADDDGGDSGIRTLPVDLSEWTAPDDDVYDVDDADRARGGDAGHDARVLADADEAERASRAALRRWSQSG